MKAPVLIFALAIGASAAAQRPAGQLLPSGDSVPANLLRLELELDRPLAPPPASRYVHLLNAQGKPVADAFLDIVLPSRDERRFTILLHPGRIKNGVGPNLAFGPALRAGESITVRIDDPRLARSVTRTWLVTGALSAPIRPGEWKLDLPAAGGRKALAVRLPVALNASAVELLAIAKDSGARLNGIAAFGEGELVWRFVPAAPWRAGKYELRVHPSIEDPAGNRLCSAFEQERQSARKCDEQARVAFEIAG